jgi:hypothetical protein
VMSQPMRRSIAPTRVEVDGGVRPVGFSLVSPSQDGVPHLGEQE